MYTNQRSGSVMEQTRWRIKANVQVSPMSMRVVKIQDVMFDRQIYMILEIIIIIIILHKEKFTKKSYDG